MGEIEEKVADAKARKDAPMLAKLLADLPVEHDNRKAFISIGNAARAIHAHDVALDAFETAKRFKVSVAFFGAAHAATQLGHKDKALHNIELYVDEAKHDLSFSRYIGRCMVMAAQLDCFDVADQLFEALQNTDELHSEFFLRKAFVEQMRHNHVAARLYGRKAILLDPDNVDLKLEIIKEFSPPEDFVEFGYGGKHFTFFYHELIDPARRTRASQFVELNMLEYIRDKLGPQKVILDIGCHIGNHSRFMKEFVEHDAIIGFDAAPNAAQFYCRNVPEAIFYNVALGLEDEEVSLLGDILNHRYGQSRIATGDEANRTDAKKIKTRALDSFQIQNVSLIKIDVESWELKVIEGALDTIGAYRPHIILEVWSENTEYYNESLQSLLPDYRQTHLFEDHDNPKKHDVLLSPS